MVKRKRLKWIKVSELGGIEVSISRLNNKSRKGKFINIRDGKRKSIYKFNDMYDLSAYIDAFKKRVMFTKSGIKQIKPRKRTSVRVDTSKVPLIYKVLKRGTSRVVVTDLNKRKFNKLRGNYKKLLKPLVADKLLGDILSSYGNVEKWKSRLFYKIQIVERDGSKPIATLRTHGKHLESVYGDVINAIIGNKVDMSKLSYLVREKGYSISNHTDVKYDEYPKDIQIKLIMEYTKK